MAFTISLSCCTLCWTADNCSNNHLDMNTSESNEFAFSFSSARKSSGRWLTVLESSGREVIKREIGFIRLNLKGSGKVNCFF